MESQFGGESTFCGFSFFLFLFLFLFFFGGHFVDAVPVHVDVDDGVGVGFPPHKRCRAVDEFVFAPLRRPSLSLSLSLFLGFFFRCWKISFFLSFRDGSRKATTPSPFLVLLQIPSCTEFLPSFFWWVVFSAVAILDVVGVVVVVAVVADVVAAAAERRRTNVLSPLASAPSL